VAAARSAGLRTDGTDEELLAVNVRCFKRLRLRSVLRSKSGWRSGFSFGFLKQCCPKGSSGFRIKLQSEGVSTLIVRYPGLRPSKSMLKIAG
jgi:hypothetical protein